MFIHKTNFLVVVLMMCASILWAEVPVEITYNGRLRESGLPITGTRTMSFKIYAQSTGSNSLWNSGDLSVDISSGVFSKVLTPDVDWREKDLWIETTIQGNILAPREKLTAQAFALHSKTAEDISKSAGQNINMSVGSNVRASLSSDGEFKTLSNNTTYYMVPKGSIIMWSGSIATIPSGWVLCNGANGTPDLRDRFIVGAGSSYAVNAAAGSASHSHSVDISHTHTYSGTTSIASSRSSADGNTGNPSGMLCPYDHTQTFSGTTSGAGPSSFSSNSSSNLPPYFALAFIMKL
jgi:hypothetical protein